MPDKNTIYLFWIFRLGVEILYIDFEMQSGTRSKAQNIISEPYTGRFKFYWFI